MRELEVTAVERLKGMAWADWIEEPVLQRFLQKFVIAFNIHVHLKNTKWRGSIIVHKQTWNACLSAS